MREGGRKEGRKGRTKEGKNKREGKKRKSKERIRACKRQRAHFRRKHNPGKRRNSLQVFHTKNNLRKNLNSIKRPQRSDDKTIE